MKPPTKWHLARVGALTWMLGIVTGWMLFSRTSPPLLQVPGATRISVVCPGYRATAEADRIPLRGPGHCEVEATLEEGRTAKGRLRVTLRGTQICRPNAEVLKCDSSVP